MLVAACGTGRTLVMETPQRKAFSAAKFMRADDTVPVPEEYRAQEGRIGSGFFGGSMREAVDKAADEIASTPLPTSADL